MDSHRIELDLRLKNGNKLFFDLTRDDVARLFKVLALYEKLPEYNKHRDYANNMIKVASSDIDIENAGDTSVIESLAAICCKKIKNKNQTTAFNLLNMLKSGILEEHTNFSHQYIIEIWSQLTYKNRNIMALQEGYRNRKVEIRKIDKKHPLGRVIYVAPAAKFVESMMTDLINFNNHKVLHRNSGVNAILKSIIFIAYFVYVHPFMDGNGRTARLLGNKILIDNGLSKFRYISINSEITKVKSKYSEELQNIETADNGDITAYIRFMIGLFDNLLSRMSDVNRLKLNYAELNHRQRVMLQCIKGQSQGIHVKLYKQLWNSIASEQKLPKINTEAAKKDLEKLFQLDFIIYDTRYTLYPGFKYYNK